MSGPHIQSAPPVGVGDDERWLVQAAVSAADGAELRFAIETSCVVEVVEHEAMDPLPPGCSPFVGVLDLRGLPVPVLDLQLSLTGRALAVSPGAPPPRVLIWNDGGRWIGVLVSRTFSNRAHAPGDLLPVPEALVHAHGGAIANLLRVDRGYVYVLDITRLTEVRRAA